MLIEKSILQKAVGGRQKAENRRQEADGRRQEADGRRQQAGSRRQEADGRRQGTEQRHSSLVIRSHSSNSHQRAGGAPWHIISISSRNTCCARGLSPALRAGIAVRPQITRLHFAAPGGYTLDAR